MKGILAFLSTCCLMSCVLAKPATVILGYQDSLGQYSFGYSAPGSARSEVRTANGATHGAYSYVDEAGVIQSAQYVADGENGFRVVATNLPEAPLPIQDTAEVVAARVAHLQAVELAKKAELAESGEEQSKIGANNIFLQNVKEVEKQKLNLAEGARYPLRDQKVGDTEGKNVESVKTRSQEPGNSKDAIEVSSAKVSAEISGASSISAIPLIPSHVVLPRIVGQRILPVFRISHGSQKIEPASINEWPSAQGSSVTPAGTASKGDQEASEKIATKQAGPAVEVEQGTPENKAPIDAVKTEIITPIIPLTSSYSSFIRYAPGAPLHYVAYNIL